MIAMEDPTLKYFEIVNNAPTLTIDRIIEEISILEHDNQPIDNHVPSEDVIVDNKESSSFRLNECPFDSSLPY